MPASAHVITSEHANSLDDHKVEPAQAVLARVHVMHFCVRALSPI